MTHTHTWTCSLCGVVSACIQILIRHTDRQHGLTKQQSLCILVDVITQVSFKPGLSQDDCLGLSQLQHNGGKNHFWDLSFLLGSCLTDTLTFIPLQKC